MKLKIVLMIFILMFLITVKGVEIKFIEKINLEQEKEIIQVCVSFVVTEDNNFFLADVKGADIKVYDSKGYLLKVIGRKGAGPNEFLAPISCDYYNKEIAVADVVKREIQVFKVKGRIDLELKKKYICTSVGMPMSLMDDGILIGASKYDPKGKLYDLFIQHFDNRQSFLMPSGVKYGMIPFEDVRNIFRKRPDIEAIGSDGKCDWENNHVYYFWEGNLKVFKINKRTKKIDSFGKKTSNYVTAFGTKKLIEAKKSLNIKAYNEEKKKMSMVKSIFANENFVGLLYNSPDKSNFTVDSNSKFMLQFYKLNGDFLNEVEISNNYSEMYMKQWGDYIYFLTSRVDEDLNEIYKILKYKLTENNI